MPKVSADSVREPTSVVVRDLRPRQIQAALLLVQGQQGRQVAEAVGIAAETLSRWKSQPEFEALMRDLLQQQVDAVRLGIISLTTEAITHLRFLVNAFDDKTSLRACALVLGKVGPVLGVIGQEMRQHPAPNRE